MLKLFGYSVLLEPTSSCDMMSFGFWCKKMPTKAIDSFGLVAGGANLNGEDVGVAISKCRVAIIDSISSFVDVDEQLLSEEAFEEALHSSVNLMKSARYDVPSYVEWARSEHLKVKQLLAVRAQR